MNEQTFAKEIKWHNRKLLLRSFVCGVIFLVLFCGLAKRAEPPEGYLFERLPAINGVYKCCEAGGRYSRSWIGHKTVVCAGFTYYPFLGTNRNDCGFKAQLDGQPVEAVETYVPSLTVSDSVVIKLKTPDITYIDLSDAKIRERWISGSMNASITLASIFAVIFHGVQLIRSRQKIKNLLDKK